MRLLFKSSNFRNLAVMGLTHHESHLRLLTARLPFILPANQGMLTSYLGRFGSRLFGIVVDMRYHLCETIDHREISTLLPTIGTPIRVFVCLTLT